MDTMKTTADILTFNGSVRPAMVALTPNELALIAEAPAMAEALAVIANIMPDARGPHRFSAAQSLARAILARIKGAA